MSFTPERLLQRLGELETEAKHPVRYIIALSGGLDSSALAHALASTRDRHGKALLAIHIDHQLHDGSADWGEHCRQLAAGLEIEFLLETVDVDTATGSGLEAAARAARYEALAAYVQPGDWLLSAHHRDDQSETLLLNLMRGSGPAGLRGIGAWNSFAGGWLVRPLIDVARDDLQHYASSAGLEWLEDPSNTDTRFDRNFLRHEVMPVLERRWPGAASRLARSADLASEASDLMDALAEFDLRSVGDRPERIDISGLPALSPARQRNLLRYAVRRAGLPLPTSTQLDSVLQDVIPAREDAQPLVTWPGAEVRRYRDKLYILPAGDGSNLPEGGRKLGSAPLELSHGLGTLELSPGAALGLSDAVIAQGLSLHYRRGGEEIKPINQLHTKKLKKLLQEDAVVPWMRERLPLVYAAGRLVAVADLWIASHAASEPGTAIRWRNKPALH